ncbi:MAG: type II toxin-antitoxin system RelE/ParE family toxin [Flavobacteriales bacterium]|nr:type II toxin-antitoxin system RelE/ParE family toxin [Flavobacteriales bacterium]MCC6938328.1 type II toxin-antitoxin system RelE/ParE family toxin [Flavobacteriales bacterium]
MAGDRTVEWSYQAMEQVDSIKQFILSQWSVREVDVFLDLLREFEQLVMRFPNGYQRSLIYPGCRRAVIHPNISVVYKVIGDTINVVTVYDNRSSVS